MEACLMEVSQKEKLPFGGNFLYFVVLVRLKNYLVYFFGLFLALIISLKDWSYVI